MLEIEYTRVDGFEAAVRGMRNPLNSWSKSDSAFMGVAGMQSYLGEADLELMRKLVAAGTDHAKFRRMITVTADITAPIYWWKEYDTYKVGTVANSCSTMHTIHKAGITKDLFSFDGGYVLTRNQRNVVEAYMLMLEELRMDCKTGDDRWRALIQYLPCGFNQRRTVMLNYEVLANMYKSRRIHKLREWHEFCNWVSELPYAEIITGGK